MFLDEGTAAVQTIAAIDLVPHQPHVISWRAIVESTPGGAETADAVIRISQGSNRMLVAGEGANVHDALEVAALRARDQLLSHGPGPHLEAVRMQLGLSQGDDPRSAGARLHVLALHENAMLTRLTALMGQHDVDSFTYAVDGGGRVRAVVGVRGSSWQVSRVAARLRRVIGVLDVLVEP